MLLVLQIAAGILLARAIYKGVPWAVRKLNERRTEEKYVKMLAAEIKSDREGEGEWLRSTPKKN